VRPSSLLLTGLAALAASTSVRSAEAAPPPASASSRNVRATLLSEKQWVQPGQKFWLGLRLETGPGWHVYWKQPGDAGLPPRLRWTLPAPLAAQDLVFPYPERFATGALASYGYTGDVLLLVPMTAAKGASGTVELTTDASWLECRETCIPGKATLGLSLPVQAGPPRAVEANAPLFAAARQRVPRPARGWRFEPSGDTLVLRAPAAWKAPAGKVEFFCAQDNVIRFGAPQRVRAGADGWGLELARDPNGAVPPSLQGVLVAHRGANVEAIEIEALPRKETP
jgi:DsbC/DsbD-like thiol-disulfide interchange protein